MPLKSATTSATRASPATACNNVTCPVAGEIKIRQPQDQAGDGAPDAGAQDGRDHFGRLEERGALRRQLFETTNSLSVSGHAIHSLEILLVVVRRVLETLGIEGSLNPEVRRCVPRAHSLTNYPRPPRTTRKSYGPRVPDRTMVST